jgi:hypothetical protein
MAVYFAQAGELNRVKIGCTSSVFKRIQALQTGCPEPLRVHLILPEGDRKLEAYLHKTFAKSRVSGEWFYYFPQISSFVNKILERQEKEAEEYWEKKEQDYWDEQQEKWEAEPDAQESS